MKNRQINIQELVLLAVMMVSMMSCANNDRDEDYVKVNFTASLPLEAQTRSFGNGSSVNMLVVGVFDSQKKEIARERFAIHGTMVNVEFTLVEQQTYSFVFWAYNDTQNIYDMSNLTAIKMNDMPQSVTFSQVEAMDAFFAAKKDVIITDNKSYTIELVRPLAQINVGSTGRSMNAVLAALESPDTFYPLTNSVSGKTNFTWNFNVPTSETFSVDGTLYNYLAMGYVFAPANGMSIESILDTYDNGQPYRTFRFPEVKIQANFKSNIGGGFTAE